jgi:excisionase family DNA binding protein
MPDKLLYSVAPDVTELTGLSRTKLHNEMSAGRLRYVKVGTRRLIPHAALTAYIRLLESEAATR